ncbi:MAG: shikimate kinase [Candidatus Omnitrophica bacterium]|nr:shikimate kinase [Candidatus Omnitrophota bacterium]
MIIASKNIVLIGFMACGKTFTSRELAVRLKRERVSTDELIVQREKRSIADIFAQSGEPYFRQLERQVVADLASRQNLIIDCGGGVARDEVNFNALKKTGISFYLYASPEAIFRRTRGTTDRPLLNVSDPLATIKQLLAERDPFYRKADFLIDSNEDNIGKVVDDVLGILSRSAAGGADRA